MTLLEISIGGAVMIAVIALIRAFSLKRLPKRVFILMWELAILRLILPFSVEVPLLPAETSDVVPSSPSNVVDMPSDAPAPGHYMPQFISVSDGQPYTETEAPTSVPSASAKQQNQREDRSFPWTFVWAIGAVTFAAYFICSYLYEVQKFRTSLPIENSYISKWLTVNGKKRKISVRYSDRISSPLTYGVLRPVILMPKNIDMSDERCLGYVLEHEYSHVCHYDSLKKPVATLALCLHWFNPFVWVAYFMYNRDMELWCDECVLRRYGYKSRSAYAHTLINMEALRNVTSPLLSCFRKNSIEERIVSIMKYKKVTLISVIFAIVLIAAVTVTVVAASIDPVPKETENPNLLTDNDEPALGTDAPVHDAVQSSVPDDIVDDAYTTGDVDAENSKEYKTEYFSLGGKASLSQVHDIYKNGEHIYDSLVLNASERAITVFELDAVPTDEQVNALSANALLNGNNFYRMDKSVINGNRIACLFTAPVSGEYNFSLNYNAEESISFRAYTVAENTGEPYVFGDISLSDADFADATLTSFDPANVEVSDESTVIMTVYRNSQNESYYRLLATCGGTNFCLPLNEKIFERLGINEIISQKTMTLSFEEFSGWLTDDLNSLHYGMTVYNEFMGYLTVEEEDEEYNPEKDMMTEEEYNAMPKRTLMSELQDLLTQIIENMPYQDVTLNIVLLHIQDVVSFSPGAEIDICDVRTSHGAAVINNADGTYHLTPGTYDIWWAYDGTDKELDYRQPVEIGCKRNDGNIKSIYYTVIYTNADEEKPLISYLPGPYTLSFNILTEGDYTFYIKNVGDTTLPIIYTRLISEEKMSNQQLISVK